MVTLDDLARTKLATGLNHDQLRVLCDAAELRDFRDGEPIVDAAKSDYDLFALVKGRARVLGLFGQEVNVIESGSLIGELAFLDKQGRSASVVSVGPSTVAVLSDTSMDRLEAEHPDVAVRLQRSVSLALCEKLRRATRMIEALSISYV